MDKLGPCTKCGEFVKPCKCDTGGLKNIQALPKKEFWRWVELKAQFLQMMIEDDAGDGDIAEEWAKVKHEITDRPA